MSEPVYLLVADLVASNPQKWKATARASSKIKLSLYHIAPLKHWAILVRNQCYEVNRRPRVDNPRKVEPYLNICGLDEWLQRVAENNVKYEQVEVGSTERSDQFIQAESRMIWDNYHGRKYRLDKKNCQNFAYLLFEQIAQDPKGIKKRMMPRRFSEMVDFVKSTMTSSVARMIVRQALLDGVLVGAEIVGVEGLLGLEVLGLEAAGAALLGPVGEAVFVLAIVAMIYHRNRDKKWLKQGINKLRRKGSDDNVIAESTENFSWDMKKQANVVLREVAAEIEMERKDDESRPVIGGGDLDVVTDGDNKIPAWGGAKDIQKTAKFLDAPSAYDTIGSSLEEWSYRPPLPPRPGAMARKDR